MDVNCNFDLNALPDENFSFVLNDLDSLGGLGEEFEGGLGEEVEGGLGEDPIIDLTIDEDEYIPTSTPSKFIR